MKLSIVTICYNSENCIDKTIRSVLAQTRPVYEYIVVDGGSSDATYEKVCSYEKAFAEKGIIYRHLSEKDRGISDAFNKGIERAEGELIGLINADDELTPDACKFLGQAYEKTAADIYYGNCIWQDGERNRSYLSKPGHEMSRLLYKMILIHSSTFVTKRAYEQCGLFDITYRYCMDEELLYRMHCGGMKFHYIDEALTVFKSGGISDTQYKAVLREGSRLALSYGEPYAKVKLVESVRIVREICVRFLKIVPFYGKIKEWKDRICR